MFKELKKKLTHCWINKSNELDTKAISSTKKTTMQTENAEQRIKRASFSHKLRSYFIF
ncbi:uncharacterized protein DS421_6g189230 [Arachis hypogaea]|nr:uncharacterized protein DS421_6g189230 [Arachis hypogaea]